MPKIYKCPICGCTEYYEIPAIGKDTEDSFKREIIHPRCFIEYEIEISGDASLRINTMNVNANICLCKKCGHMDLFNEGMLLAIQQSEARIQNDIKAKEQGLINLKQEQKDIEIELKRINEELANIGKLLLDDELTIRKHNELEEESKRLGADRPLLEKRIKEIPDETKKLEQEIEVLKWDLEHVTSVRSKETNRGYF